MYGAVKGMAMGSAKGMVEPDEMLRYKSGNVDSGRGIGVQVERLSKALADCEDLANALVGRLHPVLSQEAQATKSGQSIDASPTCQMAAGFFEAACRVENVSNRMREALERLEI